MLPPPTPDEDENSPEVLGEVVHDGSEDIVVGPAELLRGPPSPSSVIDLTLDDDDDDDNDIPMSAPTASSKHNVPIKSEPTSSEQFAELPSLAADDQHSSLEFQELDPGFLEAMETVGAVLDDGDNDMNEAFLNWSESGGLGATESQVPDKDVSLNLTSNANDGFPKPAPDEPSESHTESEQARAKFLQIEDHYNKRKAQGETTQVDDIEFCKAQGREQQRIELIERQRKAAEAPAPEDDEKLFVSEDERANSPEPTYGHDFPSYVSLKSEKRKSVYEPSDADSEGDSILQDPHPTTGKRNRGAQNKRQPRKADPKKIKSFSTTRVRKPRAKKNKISQPTVDLANLLTHDIVQEARANQQLNAGPEFKGRNKRTALTEYIGSMPEDQRDLHTNDKKAIEDSVKQFKNCRLDGAWRLEGQRYDQLSPQPPGDWRRVYATEGAGEGRSIRWDAQ